MVIKNESGEVIFVTNTILRPGDVFWVPPLYLSYIVLRVEDNVAVAAKEPNGHINNCDELPKQSQ